MLRRISILVFIAIVNVLNCYSSTYYISPNGNDSTGDGSNSMPWKTSTKAFTQGGGHSYIFKNGIYNYDGGNIANPPSGTSGNPTIIKAETDGGAIIDGNGVRAGIIIGIYTTREYITVEGFKVINTGENPGVAVGSPDGTPISNQTNNIVIRRTGASAGIQASNGSVWAMVRVRDSVLEDIWGWGEGRYTLNIYGCTSITVRRAVLRWDGWGSGAAKPGDPKFNLSVYNTHDSLFENILLLDHATTALGGDVGGLYVPSNDNGDTAPYTDSDNNIFYGIISLNNFGIGIIVEGGSGGTNDNNVFINSISWGNSGAGISVPRSASNTQFNHVTVGETYVTYFGDNNVTSSSIINSLVIQNTYGLNGSVSSDYNIVFNNDTDYAGGASSGPNSMSSDPQLKYITEISNGTVGKGAASDGGDIGATVVYKYQNGILTSDPLWPWPYENRIKEDMYEYSTRGFCSAVSLTNYILEYLGNSYSPLPAEIEAPKGLRLSQ